MAEKASVSIYDPRVEENQIWFELGREHGDLDVLKRSVAVCGSPYDACAEADAVVVMTEWEQFSNKSDVPTASTVRSNALGRLDPNHVTTPKLSSAAVCGSSKSGQQPTSYSLERQPDEVVPGSAQGTGQLAPNTGQSTREPPRSSTGPKSRPVALDLKLATINEVASAQPTAALHSLHSARFIDRIQDITSPGSVILPNPSLKATAAKKLKYETNFLLQFKEVFSEKPSLDWDRKIQETIDRKDRREEFSPNDRSVASSKTGNDSLSNERLDWARIAKGMRKPMFVFDGRNVLDAEKLEKLGFKVEAIGKAGKDFMRGREFE